MRRSILAVVIVAALLAGPLALAFGGCISATSACDAICAAAGAAVVADACMGVDLEPTGPAPSRPVQRPSAVFLRVPQPPPKPASLFV